jgi:formylglycine-generating enzyme required for sulfatase activity
MISSRSKPNSQTRRFSLVRATRWNVPDPVALPTILWFLVLISIWTATAVRLESAPPPGYTKQGTWFDTFLASAAALDLQGLDDRVGAYESPVMRGGNPAIHISVDVAGADELYLFVSGDPNKIWGVANWAEPMLIDKAGTKHPLTTPGQKADGKPALEWRAIKGRFDININLHSGLYEPLRIRGRQFDRGIHVQADSIIRVPLAGKYEKFTAWIGIDDWAGTNGSLRFRVLSRRAAALEQLWDAAALDFPQDGPRREMRWEQQDRIWNVAWSRLDLKSLAIRYAEAAGCVPPLGDAATALATNVNDLSGLREVRAIYLRARSINDAIEQLRAFDYEALRLAIEDKQATFTEDYPQANEFLSRLDDLSQKSSEALSKLVQPGEISLADYESAAALSANLQGLKSEALLANPLLDFERLLLIKRRPQGDPRRSQWTDRGLGEYVGMPRQSSWGLGTMPDVDRWENEIAVLEPVHPRGRLRTVFRPEQRRLVSDIDVHWDAERMLISMPDDRKLWQVFELSTDGQRLRQLTSGDHPDVHNYDSCYLPNRNIAFVSTAPLQGVPCNAGVIVGMIYLMNSDGGNIRQICFEQDHDYTPSVLNDGRVLYLRWDYTDTPHVWNRLLMSMNPDGTGQMEFYGSNSYWPNSIFFARAVPGHPTKVVGIVTGHHEGRAGDMILFDPALGRHEAQGVVQQIPGRKHKVQPVIEDKPTEHNWPKFLHPWPLSDKYFLATCKPATDALWGVYLVDVFDNMTLIREEEEFALLEPIPLQKRPVPPVIQDRVRPESEFSTVYLQDVYRGPGLKDVPRGSVKSLRLFSYHFGFQRMAGIDHRVGTDGPWEIKRVLGTVPVEEDGSAMFKVPAKTPISVQPLDAEGKALALMRSWMTAMPGEVLSCVGCHDSPGHAPPNVQTFASLQRPRDIEPWHGPVRGFSFAREVQPVLDRYCVGCHNDQPQNGRSTPIDLRADQGRFFVYEHGNPQLKSVPARSKAELIGKYAGVFEPSYVALRQFIRVGGLESDLHVLPAKEFHSDTSELIQMLKKGHHNVRLDAEAWDRLVTWIDLNAPCAGTWGEVTRIPIAGQPERRRLLRQAYGGVDEDAEVISATAQVEIESLIPQPWPSVNTSAPDCEGWPLDSIEAKRRQLAPGPAARVIDLGDGVLMELVRIPAGRFVMGDPAGDQDELPLRIIEIPRPFWMAKHEVSNEQFQKFNPAHDSRFEHRSSWMFDETYLGWPLNRPKQPVVRVSWDHAMAFCQWLSHHTGLDVTLPTEEQWEYACRAGSNKPFSYGELDSDFSRHANLADANIRKLADDGWRPRSPDLAPRDARYDDGALVTTEVGSYLPNAWGLHDMHGNAAEWTSSNWTWDPAFTGGAVADAGLLKVVRGGSWRDRPKRARSGFRIGYPSYQRVFNVGFRVIIEDTELAGGN